MDAIAMRFNAIADVKTLVFIKFSFYVRKNAHNFAHLGEPSFIVAMTGTTVCPEEILRCEEPGKKLSTEV